MFFANQNLKTCRSDYLCEKNSFVVAYYLLFFYFFFQSFNFSVFFLPPLPSTEKYGSELCWDLVEGDQFHASNNFFSENAPSFFVFPVVIIQPIPKEVSGSIQFHSGVVCVQNVSREEGFGSRKTLPPLSLPRHKLLSTKKMVSDDVTTASYPAPTNAR